MKLKTPGHAFLAVALLLMLTTCLHAQSRSSYLYKNHGRNADSFKSLLSQVAGDASQSICKIESKNRQVALGFVVSNDGLIVTKHSLMKSREPVSCVFESGASSVAEIIAVHADYDLVLLRIAAETIPLPMDAELPPVSAGQIVFAPNHEGQSVSMGLISAEPRRFRTRQFISKPMAYLGVECRNLADTEGLLVRRVTGESGAKKAGLKPDDVLLKLDDTELREVNDLVRQIRKQKPGDAVQLTVLRDDETMTISATLGKLPASTEQDKWGGGPFSKRRFGFPAVIASDTLLQPNECGGPLLDSKGNLVGLNIARALRSVTYSVPVVEVKKFVDANRQTITSNTLENIRADQ